MNCVQKDLRINDVNKDKGLIIDSFKNGYDLLQMAPNTYRHMKTREFIQPQNTIPVLMVSRNSRKAQRRRQDLL